MDQFSSLFPNFDIQGHFWPFSAKNLNFAHQDKFFPKVQKANPYILIPNASKSEKYAFL